VGGAFRGQILVLRAFSGSDPGPEGFLGSDLLPGAFWGQTWSWVPFRGQTRSWVPFWGQTWSRGHFRVFSRKKAFFPPGRGPVGGPGSLFGVRSWSWVPFWGPILVLRAFLGSDPGPRGLSGVDMGSYPGVRLGGPGWPPARTRGGGLFDPRVSPP